MKILEFFYPRARRRRLLKVLLDNSHLFNAGLCYYVIVLINREIISYRDFNYLNNIIRKNRPTSKSPHYDKDMAESGYYWPINKWEPREKWLKDILK